MASSGVLNKSLCCRVCTGNFFSPPLLIQPNSPSSAQGFEIESRGQTSGISLEIYQCVKCGLVQHTVPPVNYYREVIRAIAFSIEMEQFRINQFRGWINAHHLKDKRIIEIGCGRGEYMNLLQKAGAAHVFGLEYSLTNVQYANDSGYSVFHGYLDESSEKLEIGKFDAFSIFSFLEHWPDPSKSLLQLNRFLNDGAQGIIEVPNFDFILSNNLYSEFIVDHIFYFNKSSLCNLLESNGFSVQFIEPIWHDYILSASVSKRKPIDSSGFVKRQSHVIEQIIDYVSSFSKSNIVVWGAGHQALAVISMADLGFKISHIVDSAKFKQNRYTPGSDLLIKHPDSLLTDRPSALLIIAASYSDEVCKIVLEKYSFIKNIAVLRENNLEIICKDIDF